MLLIESLFLKNGSGVASQKYLFAWGNSAFGQVDTSPLGPGLVGASSWTSVSAGRDHTVAIRSDGSLFAWGLGTFGRLGDNTTA